MIASYSFPVEDFKLYVDTFVWSKVSEFFPVFISILVISLIIKAIRK